MQSERKGKLQTWILCCWQRVSWVGVFVYRWIVFFYLLHARLTIWIIIYFPLSLSVVRAFTWYSIRFKCDETFDKMRNKNLFQLRRCSCSFLWFYWRILFRLFRSSVTHLSHTMNDSRRLSFFLLSFFIIFYFNHRWISNMLWDALQLQTGSRCFYSFSRRIFPWCSSFFGWTYLRFFVRLFKYVNFFPNIARIYTEKFITRILFWHWINWLASLVGHLFVLSLDTNRKLWIVIEIKHECTMKTIH